MNGMSGTRRSARPVRITLASSLGGDIDGAWWPYTGSIARELPELIGALHRLLGEIIDIDINWSAMEGAPDLNSMSYGLMSIPTGRGRPQRLMVITGRCARAKLLVVPHMTTPALGLMVMLVRIRRRRVVTLNRECEAVERVLRGAHQVVPDEKRGENERGHSQQAAQGSARH